MKLSGFAPFIPRLNNVGWHRTKDRYSDEYGKLCRPKREVKLGEDFESRCAAVGRTHGTLVPAILYGKMFQSPDV